MRRKAVPEIDRQALIQQNLHAILEQGILGFLKCLNCHLTRNRGKLKQELT